MSSIREVILCAGALAIGCTSAAPAREPVAPALAKRALQAASRGARAPYPSAHPDPLYALPEVMDRPESWRRGVALGLFASTPVRAEQQRIYGLLLDEIVALGATDVSLVVRWSIDHVRAHRIAPEAGVAVDDAILSWVIEAAHTRGLRTLLLPILYLDERAPGVWRGTLAPHDLDAWWTHYDAFILHYAEFAARHDVSLYSVGSELLSMETQDERWRALIARVRARFSGELTYSSNWDHFEVPSFWDALDVVGMTAYQELSHRDDPSTHELVRGWSPFHARLKNWAREHQKRFIFTEIGYPKPPRRRRTTLGLHRAPRALSRPPSSLLPRHDRDVARRSAPRWPVCLELVWTRRRHGSRLLTARQTRRRLARPLVSHLIQSPHAPQSFDPIEFRRRLNLTMPCFVTAAWRVLTARLGVRARAARCRVGATAGTSHRRRASLEG